MLATGVGILIGFDSLSGVSLTPGRTTEKEGHLTVGDSLLGEIVVDDESVLSVVTEPFTHGALEQDVSIVLKKVVTAGTRRGICEMPDCPRQVCVRKS